MSTVFLSHSSKDKPAVRKLAEQLKAHVFTVWLDEFEIDVGDSIPDTVAKGLQESEFVAVWLTQNAVTSGWVTKEWQTKIAQEISARKVAVLPLLAEDCDIPVLFAEKHFADFRTSFEEGTAQLLRTLRRKSTTQTSEAPDPAPAAVLHNVQNFLRDLEEAEIPFPTMRSLRIVDALRTIPRSGKLIRLETMQPKVPIRSIYDHILSVGHSAEVLLPELKPPLADHDLIELARVIVYHDACEVILGDVPQYTRLTHSKRRRARVSAQARLSQLPDGEPERIANEFIGMFLQGAERQSLATVQQILRGDSEVRRFYYAMDKLDPIVATWRYIHYFRGNPSFPIGEYLLRMRHFFENPKVAQAVERNVKDKRLVQFVRQLQSPDLARAYSADPALLDRRKFALPAFVVRSLIEGRSFEFAEARPARRSKRPAT